MAGANGERYGKGRTAEGTSNLEVWTTGSICAEKRIQGKWCQNVSVYARSYVRAWTGGLIKAKPVIR